MRASWSRSLPRLLLLQFALLSAACGGTDLTLPGPGDPATLTIVAGDGQSAAPGEMLTDPLVVQLQDGIGRPVAGTRVAFRFTDAVPNAAVDPGTATTDSAGRATAAARLGEREGSQAIEALVAAPGEDLRVRFELTAQAPSTGGGGGGGKGHGHGGKGEGD